MQEAAPPLLQPIRGQYCTVLTNHSSVSPPACVSRPCRRRGRRRSPRPRCRRSAWRPRCQPAPESCKQGSYVKSVIVPGAGPSRGLLLVESTIKESLLQESKLTALLHTSYYLMMVDMLMLEVLLSSPLPLVALLSVYRLLDRRSCTNHSSASVSTNQSSPCPAPGLL